MKEDKNEREREREKERGIEKERGRDSRARHLIILHIN
jgi:hypothetical protein